MNKKGFTLIELLAVIIILGILMIIAIPSVTRYISDSRKSAYIDTAKEIISGARNLVNEGKLELYDTGSTYYIPSSCINTENTIKSPYGDFVDAYVIVTYDGKGYDYYWASIDETGTGIELTSYDDLDTDLIKTDMEKLKTTSYVGLKSNIILFNNNCKSYTTIVPAESLKSYLINLSRTDDENMMIDEYNNVRYIGKYPNNYVKFENTDKMWRMIGIVDGYVKLQSVDLDIDGFGGTMYQASWSHYRAMTTANTTYLENLGEDITKYIVDYNWRLAGFDSYENYNKTAREIIVLEKGNCIYDDVCSVYNKVGIMYASDYLYASSEPGCLDMKAMNRTYGDKCSPANWMYHEVNEATITGFEKPGHVISTFINYNGGLGGLTGYRGRATIHISEDAVIKSGSGKENDPYIIGEADDN